MCSTHPPPTAASRNGLWAGSHCSVCCCAPLMLVVVLNTSTTPLCVLRMVFLSLSVLHLQHPSPHPLTVPIQPPQAASCKEPCDTHGARAELGRSFICFALASHNPTAAGARLRQGQMGQQEDTQHGGRSSSRWGADTSGVLILPGSCLGLSRLLSRVWAGHESKGKKNKLMHPPLDSERAWRGGSSCLFKVQTSAVNLLPVCISLEPLSVEGEEMGSPLCAGAGSGYWKWR